MGQSPRRIYLDHNASTPLAPEAAAVMSGLLDAEMGNPSSVHGEGRQARETVERARKSLAALVSAAADDVVLAGSGTEAVQLGLLGVARAARAAGAPPRVLIGATEHPCMVGAAVALEREGFAIAVLAVGRDGRLDLDRARAQIAGGAAAIGVSLANHETGTIQPLAELAELAAGSGAHIVCDAVQAAGKLALDGAALGVSALAISAHKFYGPKGIGALWLAPSMSIEAAIGGGHQERERRPGTENVIAIAGAGVAAALALERREDDLAAQKLLAAALEAGLTTGGGEIIASGAPRVANTTCVRFAGAPADAMVAALDLCGFAISAGAACTSGSIEPSPVLLAMGYERGAAREALRISTGRGTGRGDVQALLSALDDIVPRVRRFAK